MLSEFLIEYSPSKEVATLTREMQSSFEAILIFDIETNRSELYGPVNDTFYYFSLYGIKHTHTQKIKKQLIFLNLIN